MNAIVKIEEQNVNVVEYKSLPVMTTEQMAGFYGTEAVRIQQNYVRNSGRFTEGKHFFKVEGRELKDFATSLKIVTNSLSDFEVLSPNTRSLTLYWMVKS